MEAIKEEELKYHELTFRGPDGHYFKAVGVFNDEKIDTCIKYYEGPLKQSKCISIHDEESLAKLNQPK